MKKVLLLAVFLVSGCGWWDRTKSYYTGDASEVCIDGVVYLQFTSGSSVKYDRSGRVVVCE